MISLKHPFKHLSTFIFLLFNLLLITSADDQEQYSQEHATSSIKGNETKFLSPFLVLLSKTDISIAQLPLIENGAITVVYSLDADQAIEFKDETRDESAKRNEDGLEEEEATASTSRSSPASSRMPNADAREYEQMPPSQTQQTTTSLGKSEWQQQIATKSNNNKSISDENSTVNGVSTIRQEVVAEGEGGSKEDDSNASSKEGAGVESPSAEVSNSPRKRRSDSPLESGGDDHHHGHADSRAYNGGALKNNVLESLRSTHRKRNVTSARFARGTSETRTIVNQEEVGKKKRKEACSSPLPPEDDKNSPVQFRDFDVHMALGYAFVADSTGRIHKFRVSGFTGGEDPDAGDSNNFVGSLISNSLGREKDCVSNSTSPTTLTNTNSPYSSGRDDTKNESTNDDDNDHANNVPQGNVTHEQSGQHPKASGLVNSPLPNLMEGATLNIERTFYVNQKQQEEKQRGSNHDRPRVIWSRSKHTHPEMFLKSEQPPASVEQSSIERAFPLSSATKRTADNQMANETKHVRGEAVANEISTGGAGDDDSEEEEQQLSVEGKSGLEHHESGFASQPTSDSDGYTEQSLTSQLASGRRKPGTHLQTEIAVDWLNNLLFVLDKYRLFVVDFDGNNELVLIDDFDHNNRPIDIKVDPANNFLFWLNVGNFHNTIYKLDLNILSMQTAVNGRLQSNASKLTSSSNIGRLGTNSEANSEFVALISHHYAHPIITNLPKQALLFTIDHKHSRIYVPLSSKNKQINNSNGCHKSNSTEKDDAEVFRSPEEPITHMNSTSSEVSSESGRNCNGTFEYYTPSNSNDQILAYNLDGTDVGPLRSADEKTHLTGFDDINDITMDTDKGYLYLLTNDGTRLFEEFKSDSDPTFYSALHNLDGKKYNKLIYFGSNQPINQKPRFNLRKFIQLHSATTFTNRQVRSDAFDSFEYGTVASSLNNRRDGNGNHELGQFASNTSYILLAMICLIVLTVYLIYSFSIQPQQQRVNNGDREGSISGLSSMSGSHIDQDVASNGYLDNLTIPKLVIEPCTRSFGTTPNLNYPGSPGIQRFIESTDFNGGNTISEQYGGAGITKLSKFPSNINYMSNEHYIPIEVAGNEALQSIWRIGMDQLRIEDQTLGRGHFAEVKLGKISCNRNEKTCPLHGSKPQNFNRMATSISIDISPTYSTADFDDLHQRVLIPTSTGSSGHGSSSTSSEFTVGPNNLEVGNGDYLMPKSQCNSRISDYANDNQIFSNPDSYSSYYNSSICPSMINNHQDRVRAPSCSESNEQERKVAIKLLKSNANNDEKMDFLNEAVKLANLKHPNIVQLIGICFDGGHKMIIMELMSEGDLIRYIQMNVNNLMEEELLKICLDIVNGCCCLEREGIVHRDLAARNCLVGVKEKGERVVKLADFGLARDIHRDSYYTKQSDSPMPLKWMAPESLSLSQRKFTTKSDVWSFGVVMWEVMSRCKEKPFADQDPGSMLQILERGTRLKKPETCCEELYKLMTDCWQFEESKRPTFQECRAELIEIKNTI